MPLINKIVDRQALIEMLNERTCAFAEANRVGEVEPKSDVPELSKFAKKLLDTIERNDFACYTSKVYGLMADIVERIEGARPEFYAYKKAISVEDPYRDLRFTDGIALVQDGEILIHVGDVNLDIAGATHSVSPRRALTRPAGIDEITSFVESVDDSVVFDIAEIMQYLDDINIEELSESIWYGYGELFDD